MAPRKLVAPRRELNLGEKMIIQSKAGFYQLTLEARGCSGRVSISYTDPSAGETLGLGILRDVVQRSQDHVFSCRRFTAGGPGS